VQFLTWFAILVNLVGLAVTLSLGLYLVTRTPRSRLAWLAALALWATTAFALHVTLIITWPESGVLPLLRPVAIVTLALGFHLTLLLPPGREPAGQDFYLPALNLPPAVEGRLRGLAPAVSRAAMPLAYGLALVLVVGGAFPTSMSPEPVDRAAILLSDRVAPSLYPLSLVYLVVIEAMALIHQWTGRRAARGRRQKRRHDAVLLTVAITTLAGLYLVLGVWLNLPIPSFPGDAAVWLAVVALGYVVADHYARLDGRAIKQDLAYIALIIGALTLFYVVVAEFLYLGGHVFSTLTLVLIIIVAISSLMLYDGLRMTLDRIFYREQFRQLRANLRALAREAGIGQPLPGRLQAILVALCRTRQIQRGLIALRQGQTFVVQASERAGPVGESLPAAGLLAGEIADLPLPGQPGPAGMMLLVPIHAGEEQIGALVLGAREGGGTYRHEDLLLLDDLADQLAALVEAVKLQEENAEAINEMVAQFREREHALQRRVQQMLDRREEEDRSPIEGLSDAEFVAAVEDALRRLYDYSYLGEQPLAGLRVVDWCLEDCEEAFVTHIDRGKALSEVVQQALSKLRPQGEAPGRHDIPPREWHPYVILYDSYVEGEMNRDIMARLYISEGTFNRTRRRAVRSVAKALQEMERGARQRPPPTP
jgi:GAF domain-containing protein